MIIREGQEYVDQIYRERHESPIRAYSHYEYLLEKYKIMLEEME
jgi:hypothetical protein